MQRRIALLFAGFVVALGAFVMVADHIRPAPDSVAMPVETINGQAPVPSGASTSSGPTSSTGPATTAAPVTVPTPPDVPSDSGSGRRIVFSISRQRMWWVDEAGTVVRTSLVSGRPNSPITGTFRVYSRTEYATGIDGSKMQKFVRFTKGPHGWAVGFHSIPTIRGAPVQTEAQLGQPLSHGCIRQGQADADFTWQFAPVGSTVVVVA